jgi:hypothetical protein
VLFAVGETRDLRRQQLIPQRPAQPIRQLAGDVSAAAAIFPVDGQQLNMPAGIAFQKPISSPKTRCSTRARRRNDDSEIP